MIFGDFMLLEHFVNKCVCKSHAKTRRTDEMADRKDKFPGLCELPIGRDDRKGRRISDLETQKVCAKFPWIEAGADRNMKLNFLGLLGVPIGRRRWRRG